MKSRIPGFFGTIKFRHAQIGIFATIAVIATGVVILANQGLRAPTKTSLEVGAPGNAAAATAEPSGRSKRAHRYMPTPDQWNMLSVEPVMARVFRSQFTTEGKISIDEDRSTPVYSPYPGRVTKLLAKPGDAVILAGKGHETYQVLPTGTIAFDDREEARKALHELCR